MVAGCVRTLDVAELALETIVDDRTDVLGLEFFSVDVGVLTLDALVVDGVEEFGKAAAEFDAHATIGAKAENPLRFGAQILLIVVARVGWIVGRIIAHGLTPLLTAGLLAVISGQVRRINGARKTINGP